ncbi:NRDE family protein [Limibacter armeniacum]|uniref:NRDE family protein n=1 Tax=Limibacter armeniacum TaxID=466084 RepID=UPI002FE5CBC0
MCLITFALDKHPRYKLVLAANRDEFFNRPTQPMHFWEEHPDLLAGKDLQAGGTWMGFNQQGKFVAITNYRDMASIKESAPSRGHLTAGFLLSPFSAADYMTEVEREGHKYNGFNLLTADSSGFYYYSNYDGSPKRLSEGIYGLSNHLLDTPWVKVTKSKRHLNELLVQDIITTDQLQSMMFDMETVSEDQLPDTGIGAEWEKLLSSMFIKTDFDYGTRCSSAVLMDYEGNLTVQEVTYNSQQEVLSDKHYSLKLDQPFGSDCY